MHKRRQRERGRGVGVDEAGLINKGPHPMRGIILWLMGVPFGVIVLLYLFNVL